ncbi:MAG: hypothetical protein N2Z62_14715 [Rhodobacteraceae bacterium]|nr:hypothetical protein [Paracoccaceae bacterium]
MTRFTALRVAAAAALAAVPAAAKAEVSLGFGTATGYAELEYVFDDDFDQTFLNADLSFSTAAGAFGSAPALGFDAALRAFATEDDSFHAIYGALTYTTAFGKVSIGVPRPAIADMIRFPPIGGIRTFELELGLTESIAERVYLTDDTDPPLGLRYDGRFGDLSVGVSWNHFDEGGTEADVYDVVLRYDFDSIAVYAAAEHLDVSGGASDTDYLLGFEGDFSGGSAPIRAGAALFDRDAFIFADVQGARGYLTYMPTDRIDLTGSLLVAEGDAIYGIDMTYRFYRGAYAGLGVADGDDLDTTYQVSLGWKF